MCKKQVITFPRGDLNYCAVYRSSGQELLFETEMWQFLITNWVLHKQHSYGTDEHIFVGHKVWLQNITWKFVFYLFGKIYNASIILNETPTCPTDWTYGAEVALRWRHNDHAGVSNHQPHGCLLNCLFRRRSNKTSKLRVTGLCAGNSPGPMNSPHKGPVTQKIFPFDDVIMGIFWKSQINTMAPNIFPACITRSYAALVLIIYDQKGTWFQCIT